MIRKKVIWQKKLKKVFLIGLFFWINIFDKFDFLVI